jgi:hypothetical protein
MIRKLIATDNDATITILRLVLGVIFFAHGAQKMLGWFGGYGFTGTMGFFTGVIAYSSAIRVSGDCSGGGRFLRRHVGMQPHSELSASTFLGHNRWWSTLGQNLY